MVLIIVASVALVLSAVFAVLYVCYRIAFAVPSKTDLFGLPDTDQCSPYKSEIEGLVEKARSIPYEEVVIRAFDGVSLYGKYYRSSPGAPVQIMMHGYRSAGGLDFCVALPFALKNGYNVLVPDQRAHGKSGGRCLTLGIKERRDVLSWIGYATEREGPGVKVVLVGMSMGAASVLMASGLDLPENVKGIMADCGYSSPKEILKKVIRDRGYPVRPAYAAVRLGGMIFGGFDVGSASASDALTRCRIPVLLIHGEDDRFVPCEMSEENCRCCAAENKKLVTFPRAGHGMSYFEGRERYLSEMLSFLSAIGLGSTVEK